MENELLTEGRFKCLAHLVYNLVTQSLRQSKYTVHIVFYRLLNTQLQARFADIEIFKTHFLFCY